MIHQKQSDKKEENKPTHAILGKKHRGLTIKSALHTLKRRYCMIRFRRHDDVSNELRRRLGIIRVVGDDFVSERRLLVRRPLGDDLDGLTNLFECTSEFWPVEKQCN